MKKILYAALLLALTSACDRYVVTLNDTPVHEPPKLFANYSVTDPALGECIFHTVKDLKIVQVTHLTILRCSHGGIVNLNGIEQLTHIRTLDLADNNVKDIAMLFKLPHLAKANLSNNSQLDCDQAINLTEKVGQLILPEHCVN